MRHAVQGVFDDAVRRYRAGQLAAAQQRLQIILTSNPRHTDSLHLLGFIAYRLGRYETAVELVARAIQLSKDNASYHSTMGNILAAQGKMDDAAARYKQALALKPDYADAHNNLGLALAALNRFAEAVAHYERALALNPDQANTHNNLGVALKSQGRTGEAVMHFRRAIAINPDSAEAQNNLGNILYQQGKFIDAVACYQRVLALNPDQPDAHNTLGSALKGQGRVEEAIAHFRRAIAISPNCAEAYHNLGNILCDQGKFDEAIAQYVKAIAINPNFSEAHTNLGSLFKDAGKFDEAIAHYRLAIAINPDSAEAHDSLGSIFKEEGKFDEALTHYGRAIAIRPHYAESHFNRAEVRTFHRGDSDLAALERLAGRDDLPANKAPYIHFALAKALEDSGDYGRAFEQLRRGNALKRRQVSYNETSVMSFFQRISKVFDRGLLDRAPGGGDPSSTPVFVLGMPRSGSSLVEQILASHPQIHGAGELKDLEIAAGDVLSAGALPLEYPEYVRALDGAALRRIGQTYLARLPALVGSEMRITDKLPGNFLYIGLIRLILPNARFIHTTRNPIDTCVSCYSKLFTSGQYFSYDLTELGRYYRCYDQLMTHWRSVLPPGAMLDVAYEDVVNNIEGQARRLIDFCGLRWDDCCVNFHSASRPVKTASAVQVRKPLFRSSLQRWRKYEAELAPLLRELGETMEAQTAGAPRRSPAPPPRVVSDQLAA